MTDKLKELLAKLIEAGDDLRFSEYGDPKKFPYLPEHVAGAWDFAKAELSTLLVEQVPAGEWDARAWAYSIETPGGDMYEGEYAIFGDQMSAQRQVECLNDDIDEEAQQYKVVPLYRAAGRSSKPAEPRDPAGK